MANILSFACWYKVNTACHDASYTIQESEAERASFGNIGVIKHVSDICSNHQSDDCLN